MERVTVISFFFSFLLFFFSFLLFFFSFLLFFFFSFFLLFFFTLIHHKGWIKTMQTFDSLNLFSTNFGSIYFFVFVTITQQSVSLTTLTSEFTFYDCCSPWIQITD